MKYKKTGQLFYKVVAAILLPTFFLGSFTLTFAEDAPQVSVQAPVTSSDNSSPTISSVNDDVNSQQAQSASLVVPATDESKISPENPSADKSADGDPIKSLKTDTSKAKAKPMTASLSVPIQQTDQPQLSVDSKSKLTPQIDNTTGALRYSYPITLPPGRNGMTPDLSLNYNSQNTANDSVIGYGWSISTPYIQIENKHGVDQLYTGTYNDYTTSDHGELGQISGGNYQLRSDDGSLSSYVLASNTWTVTTKNGMIYTYGASAASRQDDPSNAAHIYKWMLDSVTDTNGNSISYTYYKNQGQIYPDTITYTNTSAGSGPFTVTFARSSAPVTISSGYGTGFNIITQYTTTSITAKISGTTRHVYALVYGTGDNGNKSLLSTITETGYDTSGGSVTFPATQLHYTNGNGKTFASSGLTMPSHSLGSTRQDARLGDSGDNAYVWPAGKSGTIIDINNDGYPDWVETENYVYAGGSSTNGKFYDVYLGSASGWALSTSWTSAMPVDSTGKQYQISISSNNRLADINGDGLPDWIISTPGSTITNDTSAVWLNTGTGWALNASWTSAMPTMTVSGTPYGVAIGPSAPSVNGTPVSIAPSGYNYFTNLVDVNNDGLPDLVQTSDDNFGSSLTSDHHAVYLNTGSGWTLNTGWTMPVHPTGSSTYVGSAVNGIDGLNVIIDVNNDGLPDWVETNYSPSTNENYAVWINSGTGWVRSTTWALPVHTNTMPYATFTSQGIPLGSNSSITCNYGIGGSYNCANRVNAIADINGDGLPDFVETLTGSNPMSEYDDVWINNGKDGWVQKTSWTMPKYAGYNTPIRLGNDGVYSAQLSDVNNDGLLDFVASCDCGRTGTSFYPQTSTVFINTGSSWVNGSWVQPTRSADYPYDGSVLGYTDFTFGTGSPVTHHRTAILQDINNDGSPDWIESNQFDTPPNTTPNPASYERHGVWTNPASQVDLLSSITFDHGASSSFIYAPQVVTGKNPTTQNQTVEAVTSVTINDGIGGVGTTSYAYANGKYLYYTNQTWRKFAGFQKVTLTKPDGSKVINYYHQGDGIDTATYEYSDAEAEIGKLYRTDITDGSGNLYKRTTTEWDTTLITSVNSDVYFVYPIQTITEDFDGNGTKRATAETFAYNTSTGNLTTDTNYGEVAATTPIAYTDIGSDKQVTSYSYATNGSGRYKVSDENTVDQSSVKVRETRHYYDSSALGTLTVGNETQTEQWQTGTTYVNTQKAYNSYGMPTSTTDERSKTTSYTYDSLNLYPVTVTDPLSHTMQYTYDYMFGLVLHFTDQNSNVAIKAYDGMGRIKNDQSPDRTSVGSQVSKAVYAYNDTTSGVSYVEKFAWTDGGTASYRYTFTDGLGRTVETRQQMDPGTWYKYQSTSYYYNNNGQLLKASVPCQDWGPLYGRGTCAGSTLYTTYTYDPIGRVLTSINGFGTTTNAYDDWKTTTTDPNSNVKKYYADAYSNLVKIEEINGASTYTTNYTWNLNKNLMNIADALGNVRNFIYDGLGRRLMAEDLHASSDTTFGTWSYAYDNAGNMTQSVSPKAATTNYTYDDTNRVLTEDYTGAVGTEITYAYDTCTQGIGKLCTVTMSSGANTAYTYDGAGDLSSEGKTINGNTYATSYTYNIPGDIATITYPGGAVVKYNYYVPGVAQWVQYKESGGSFATIADNFDYAPNFQLRGISFGGGLVRTNDILDASRQYVMTNKNSYNTAGADLQSLLYSYDANANITNLIADYVVTQTPAAKTVSYTYDALNRIKTATTSSVATGTPSYAETYSYDALGNIASKNGQTYLYQGNTGVLKANPNAATSVNGTTYTYDADGNLTSDGTLTNTWNYKDQMIQSVGSSTVNYYYDHNGNRAWYKMGSANTYYPNRYYSDDGTTKTKQIYIGNRQIATVQTIGGTPSLYYDLIDPIFGANVMTDSSGAKVQLLDYFPFGDIRLNQQSGSFDEKNKFGGHQYDADTDLNYMGARYYNAKIGRFISEDPTATFSPETFLSDPQQLNTYSYARNNPLTNIDPDGRQVVPALIGIASVAAMYAPQITSFVQSLTTPLGQLGISQAIDDVHKGNYGWALVGGLTSGEIPEGKALVNGIETTHDVATFLNKGDTATDVYKGIHKGEDVYVGISKNTAVREVQHGDRFSNGLQNVTNLPTRNQARAIEQVIKDDKGVSYQNIRNSISPNNSLFEGIKDWGTKFLKQLGSKN
ncbi:MAG: hypothetical protein JWL92_398 [Candidatus Nomurabacteria bacterium]|nr:hypothetical protein [Candidatus Nomurabacteria bacterium]